MEKGGKYGGMGGEMGRCGALIPRICSPAALQDSPINRGNDRKTRILPARVCNPSFRSSLQRERAHAASSTQNQHVKCGKGR